MNDRTSLEQATGELFSELWKPYSNQLFDQSVSLFTQRLNLAGFDADWFNGKVCLDAGCGGGRNSIAMAKLGAREVIGVDVGVDGLGDAQHRAEGMDNVRFQTASILDLPFEDQTFDMVWCAGVLMITADEEQALDELTRVLKKDGFLYLLVYASGGMRWPLIQWLRPLTAQIGQPAVEQAIERAGLAANKRRTFLDDLFCPALDFYNANRLERMLAKRGYKSIRRWGIECRLDHEASLEDYRTDLESLLALFEAGNAEVFGESKDLFATGRKAIEATVESIRIFEAAVERDELTLTEAMDLVIGQGHHRVLAIKG